MNQQVHLIRNTEYYLYNKFRQLITGKSALIISHRFSTVSMADRIYVIDGGRIVESGSHSELMVQNGYYADLYLKQTRLMKFDKQSDLATTLIKNNLEIKTG